MLLVSTAIRPSPIAGIGLFANESIPKGMVVWRFVSGFDYYLPAETEIALPPVAREEYLNINAYRSLRTGLYVVQPDNARFINHSFSPNVVSVFVGHDKEDEDVAARDIVPGEEITMEYSSFDADFSRYSHLLSGFHNS